MYLIFSASADNYITNKIIATAQSASDANVGQASTLDLFKLYDEAVFTGFLGSRIVPGGIGYYDAPTEISRLLIKFDLTAVSSSIAKVAELDSFKAYLSLKDINGAQIAPSKFNVAVFPVSKSWDEGRGGDIYAFNDLDQSNWATASYTDGAYDLWHGRGATAIGYLNSTDIDLIGSGSISGTEISFVGTQYFEAGHEDLYVDMTNAVSASLAGYIEDKGFLVAFSGSEETDSKTRFVKRFASRHARNEYLRPKLIIAFDDTVNDQRQSMYFSTTGSIFLENQIRGTGAYLLTGSNEVQLTGSDSLHVIIHSGSFALTASAGIYSKANKPVVGLYSSSFAISRFEESEISSGVSLATHAQTSGSLKMFERWTDVSGSYIYHTGSFVMKLSDKYRSTSRNDFKVHPTNLAKSYKRNELHRVDLHIRDLNASQNPVRKKYSLPSLRFEEAYYRIRDIRTGNIIIPFTKTENATRISSDEDGMYFTMSTANWPIGRSYTIDILVVESQEENILETGVTFKVD